MMTKISKTKITILLPCYNEEAILASNLHTIVAYLELNKEKYDWDILIVNDGSSDNTGSLADAFAKEDERINVVHHSVNSNLGIALQTGFKHATGDVIVVLDIDLSYSPDHIGSLVENLNESHADIVIASPYMKGGKVTAVPFFRRIMSRWVNAFMQMASQENFHTFTGMVRAYKKDFIQYVNLKTRDYEINPEIIYKGMILRAKIVEIPAHLDWTEQNKHKGTRASGIRILRGVFSGMMTSFIFRPYIFFLVLGSFLMLLSMYQILWLLYDTLKYIALQIVETPNLENSFSLSLAKQFMKNPQSFIVGGITFLASLQLLGLGFISLQSKRYFEELFHLGTYKRNKIH